ncbi:MAG: PIG-L family deacetylase [Candidatus Bathyarchaeota archaeon]|nr:PIG-L family deacetylase [Candidatus Bathyarchaeota archaeon]
MVHIYFSAHQDDDLIFMSPSLMDDVASGVGVWTVYLTAGDAGLGESYWQGREEGERAAYSAMGASGWRDGVLSLAGGNIASSVSADGKVRLVFLRLPDGGCLSKELAPSKALERIWEGEEVKTVNGSNRYTRERLISALVEIIRLAGADVVSTHDPEGWVAGCDHLDHLYTGRFAAEAADRSRVSLMLFRGYSSDLQPPNLPDVVYHRKRAVFEAYARHDPMIPSPLDNLYEDWLKRSFGSPRITTVTWN